MSQRDVPLARLVAMQYTRNELDFRRGTFRVRGDVIDVFLRSMRSTRSGFHCPMMKSRSSRYSTR